MSSSRLPGLDLLRTIAILAVVSLHAGQLAGSQIEGLGALTSNGWMGVDVFFVMSGYLIGTQFFYGDDGIGSFYIKRWLRTLPLYFVVLFFYIWVKPALGFPFRGEAAPYFFFLQNYTGVPDFVPSWSLCIEEQFYLIFPVIAYLVAPLRLGGLFWLLPMIASAFARFLFWRSQGGGAETLDFFCHAVLFKTHMHLDGLAAGLFVASTRRYWSNWPAFRCTLAAALGLVCLIVTVNYAGRPWEGRGFVACFTGLAAGVALLLPWLLRLELGRRAAMFFRYVALWSYGIYIWNDVVSRAVERHRPAFGSETLLVFFSLSFGIAITTYYLVELPLLRLRERILTRVRSFVTLT